MKEDILEQLVDDYLQYRGYFTRHNIKFKPRADHADFHRQQDSNHSDIDVLGYHPSLQGPCKVMAVSCKSWQSGFNVQSKISDLEGNKRRSGRAAWKSFRELMQPKWSEAFIETIKSCTACSEFTYVTAVTTIVGDRQVWENHSRFRKAMHGNPIRLLSLTEMLTEMVPELGTTVAGSQFARTLQLLKASGYAFQVAASD